MLAVQFESIFLDRVTTVAALCFDKVISMYTSQGQTVDKLFIDLGKPEADPRVSRPGQAIG